MSSKYCIDILFSVRLLKSKQSLNFGDNILKIYRAMCDEEAVDMIKYNRLSFNSSFKWFGTLDFVKNRVLDGKFNNSKFIKERYNRVFEFNFSDESFKHFEKCGKREFMLSRRKVPLVNLNYFKEILCL